MSEVTVPPACVNCLHLLGGRNSVNAAKDSWRCYHPSNRAELSDYDVVTGITTAIYLVPAIYDCRADGATCGVEGKLFELYVKPDYYNIGNQRLPAEEVYPGTVLPKSSKKQAVISVDDL